MAPAGATEAKRRESHEAPQARRGTTGSRELEPPGGQVARAPGRRAWLARFWIAVSLICAALTTTQTRADTAPGATEGPSCQTVRLSDVGWTDVTATTATLSVLLRDRKSVV